MRLWEYMLMVNPITYRYFQTLIWLTWYQLHHTSATSISYEYQPWLATDQTPDWGCPSHSTMCNLLCKSNGSVFGYCNGNTENGGCRCFDKVELKKGLLKNNFLKRNGLEKVTFPGVKCSTGIHVCDVLCLKLDAYLPCVVAGPQTHVIATIKWYTRREIDAQPFVGECWECSDGGCLLWVMADSRVADELCSEEEVFVETDEQNELDEGLDETVVSRPTAKKEQDRIALHVVLWASKERRQGSIKHGSR
ncbi:uncharacterized protein LOC119403486 [Rhipicephalus sanguineus]|uniref:uncharacterized protein LOC119403486 n=1 Tax=Rhipicephalus sanguineus TaxID=34632 RepID=UPI0020C44E54|nr:uncharacterized protein LOC119403486 [Rhipicephalus sanguineus]